MPKVISTNDGIKETVVRNVVLDVTRQVQEWTGLEETTILFPGDTEVAAQPGSTIDDEASFNNTPSRPLWRVKARYMHRTDQLLATAVHQMEYPAFFEDQALNVLIRPVKSATKVQLDFEYRASDITAATRWQDEIRAKLSTRRMDRNHVVTYNYYVPQEYIMFLEHIHTLREAQAGYGDTFEQWLRKSFAESATVVTTLAGTHERWAIREQQNRILGRFDFDELPDDIEKNGDDSAWVSSFSYQFFFDCPIAAAADYPLLVHNQLIDQKYWGIPDKDDIKKAASYSPHSLTALGAFEVPYMAKPVVESGLKFPEFHEFYPSFKYRSTLQVFSALLGLEPIDPDNPPAKRTVANFREIDEDWELRPEFLDFMKWDHKWVCKYGESLVNVSVYDDTELLDPSLYEVDEDLNLNLKFTPSLRKIFYLRLSLLGDPSVLSDAARDRLKEHGNGLVLIGAAVCPNVVKAGLLPKIFGDNFVLRKDIDKFLTRVQTCRNSHKNNFLADHEPMIWSTVMILFLQSHRADELPTE